MDVTAIIPTYNRARWLEKSIESILNQTHPVAELIVVDDGSTDDTLEICKRYPSVQVIQTPHLGPSGARNAGAKVATSPWLAFLDSDDQWHSNKLSEQCRFHTENPEMPWSYTDEVWVRKGKRVNACKHHRKSGGWIYPRALELCFISPSSIMISQKLFASCGGFDLELRSAEDYDLWLRICAHHPVHYIDQPLITKFGGHADQLSTQPKIDQFRITALEKMMADPELKPEWRELTRHQLLERCRRMAKGCEKHGHLDEAQYYQSKLNTWSSNA
jgi:glycosyltransferase involved in cell wall biosynthesis